MLEDEEEVELEDGRSMEGKAASHFNNTMNDGSIGSIDYSFGLATCHDFFMTFLLQPSNVG